MTAIHNPTPDQVRQMVRLSFGEAALTGDIASRYADVARDALANRVKPENEDAAAYVATLQAEAEAREAARVAELHAQRAETAKLWSDFEERRSAPSAPPEGKRFVSVRDEATGVLRKLALPEEFFVD